MDFKLDSLTVSPQAVLREEEHCLIRHCQRLIVQRAHAETEYHRTIEKLSRVRQQMLARHFDDDAQY